MNQVARPAYREVAYQWSKYVIYILLTANVAVFFSDEWLAADHTLASQWKLGDLIEAFAATIDTVAWVLLLLIFELETWHINPATMKRSVKHALILIRALCYFMIVSAFFGYTEKMLEISRVDLVAGGSTCELASEGYKEMVALDEFEPIHADACIDETHLALHQGQKWIATMEAYAETKALAWLDVLNAGTWLLIVGLLELDLRAAAKQRLTRRGALVSNGVKLILYLMLVIFAIDWGLNGTFIDFWDAFLWILAFVYIERNLFTSWDEPALNELPST